MLKFINLYVLLLLTVMLHAGDGNIKTTWGPEYFAPKRHYPLTFLGDLKTGFIQISHQQGKLLTIQSFSPSLALKTEKQIDLKTLPKDYDLLECLQWQGKHYLFYSTWERKEAKERLYVQEISVDKGSLTGTAKELITCEQLNGSVSVTGFYRFHTGDKFKLQLSGDSNTLGIFVNYRAQDKAEAKENSQYGFWVFDKGFKNVWKQTRVSMPYPPGKMDIEDYTADKKGNFLFLVSVYNNEIRKPIVDNAPNFHFEILRFGAESKKASIVPLNLNDKYVSQIALFQDLQGRLVCSGYYAVPDKKGKLRADGTNVDGAFVLRLNDAGDKFENIHKGFYELPDEILKQFEGERAKKKMEKKEANGEESTEQNLKLKRIIFDEDGSMILIGEQSYYVTYSYYNGKTWVTRTVYYRNDIFAQRIGKDGELLWTKKIPKAQSGGSPTGFSFRVTKYNGNYYFLFMDNAKNLNLTSAEAPASFGGGYGGVLSCVKLSDDGQMNKTILFDCKKLDQLITLEQGDWLNANTFVISSLMGTNGPNDKNKLCLIKFE
jgi:hypothetical protein